MGVTDLRSRARSREIMLGARENALSALVIAHLQLAQCHVAKRYRRRVPQLDLEQSRRISRSGLRGDGGRPPMTWQAR